jgi:hypothetical protein
MLTFGHDEKVLEEVHEIMLTSWEVYENYTSPLGVGFTCGGNHFSPDPSSRNGEYIHADSNGAGYDRTTATGSQYAGEYNGEVAANFESLERCPPEHLMAFHNVHYDQKIRLPALEAMRRRSRAGIKSRALDGARSGVGLDVTGERDAVLMVGDAVGGAGAVDDPTITLIEYIYDSHRSGVASVQQYIANWAALQGRPGMDDARHASVAAQLGNQLNEAKKWCVKLTTFFQGYSKKALPSDWCSPSTPSVPTPPPPPPPPPTPPTPSPPSPPTPPPPVPTPVPPSPLSAFALHEGKFCSTSGGGKRVLTTKTLSLAGCAQTCVADPACTCFDFDSTNAQRVGSGPECRQLHGVVALEKSSAKKDAYVRL